MPGIGCVLYCADAQYGHEKLGVWKGATGDRKNHYVEKKNGKKGKKEKEKRKKKKGLALKCDGEE